MPTFIVPRTRLLSALALAALLGLLVVLGGAQPADGARAKVLGKTKRTPPPACPRSPCQVIGSVTGLQVKADGKRQPFRARETGKVVAWSVDLSRPNKEQRQFFGSDQVFGTEAYGGTPTARISVLRRIRRSNPPRFILKRQSPTVRLGRALGERHYVTLETPLRIEKGQYLAITTPTWVPAFRPGIAEDANQWLASRPRGKCSDSVAVDARPHQKTGSKREYGCKFEGARLLYRGYYVPNRRG